MQYHQFCPIAKSLEILGEKWTLLIVRELLMGSSRFGELQRGLGTISPALLSKRLTMLAENGLVARRTSPGQRSVEYFPTESCQELYPILLALGSWGVRWAHAKLGDSDFDPGLLMLYLERSVDISAIPGGTIVVQFRFHDCPELPDWWLTADRNGTDICTSDPGKDVDLYVTTSVATMAKIWMQRTSIGAEKENGGIVLTGPQAIIRGFTRWLRPCVFADLPPPGELLASQG